MHDRIATQAVEQTIQNLIGSGMDPKTDNDPYNGFIYTSFQVSCRLTEALSCQGGWVICGAGTALALLVFQLLHISTCPSTKDVCASSCLSPCLHTLSNYTESIIVR